MKTIKIPYTTTDFNSSIISKYRQQQSIIIRYAYNRFLENKKEKDIRSLCKNLNNVELLNSWLVQSAIKKADEIYKNNKDHIVIFGSKRNFIDRIKNKISKDDYKKSRFLPIISVGEAVQTGNRLFDFKIIEDNSITFKPNKDTKIKLQLPNLRKNYKNELFQIQRLAEQKELTISIQLDERFIYLSFDETKLKYKNESVKIKNRIASIDMNPNYIGFIVKDYNSNEILHKEIISLKSLNNKFNDIKAESSDHKKVKLNNVRRNLIFEISKKLITTTNHFQCEAFVIEDLEFKDKNRKFGKKFNKLVNNQWLRGAFISNIEKRCNVDKIRLVRVYPQYSSFIGCMMYPDEVDSVAAAIEINRRGYALINYVKGNSVSVMYPKFDKDQLRNLWKERLVGDLGGDWKQFYIKVKESGVKYRLLLDDVKNRVNAVFKVFNMKKYINSYNFI